MLDGKQIGLTGTLEGLSRSDFRRLVRDAGAEYAATLSAEVDLLVVGSRPLPTRVEQARDFGIAVLDQERFQSMLDGALQQSAPPELDGHEEVPLAAEPVGDAPWSIHLSADRLRVLDIGLPRRAAGPMTPSRKRFEHYTLDRHTLSMLRFIARAVALRQPCLLEGETATSKTSAILYLAALTGHEVVRINLNGQTDTSELVGRYVPNDEDLALPVEELWEHRDLLEDESRDILERARGRALTGVERQQVAANERIERPQWRFQEGLVPTAMRKGWWVILDEVNLAEPQVLERLNSVLEREPMLVLTEGPGTRFGPGSDVPVHDDFRVFATMNPAEYQGRAVLSPAYKDRWVATWQAENPGEAEFRQMLERLVFGRQPDVEVDGLPFAGREEAQAPYASLASVPDVGVFLGRLAALHAGVVRMATATEGRAAGLGSSRRERYVFSRRGLLAVLDALRDSPLCDPASGEPITFSSAPAQVACEALERVYIDRVRGLEDRERVVNLLRSLGLHRSKWMVAFEVGSEAPAS